MAPPALAPAKGHRTPPVWRIKRAAEDRKRAAPYLAWLERKAKGDSDTMP